MTNHITPAGHSSFYSSRCSVCGSTHHTEVEHWEDDDMSDMESMACDC